MSSAVLSAPPLMCPDEESPPQLQAVPEKRKRGRPRKGTTVPNGGPVPVVQPKEVVHSGYQRACHKILSGARNQHSITLSHSEAQALLYGLRRLTSMIQECSGGSPDTTS